MKQYRTIFFGTPEFALPALEKLIKDERFNVLAVVTEPDHKSGRRKKIVYSPIKKMALENKINLLQPSKIGNLKLEIKNLQPDVAVVCAYGQIIPKEILSVPKYGFVNIHPSLLPKYRGPSPIQNAILNGDKETGVSIMKMDEKMDHGKIISDFRFQISDLNYQELSEFLSRFGAELLIKILPDYLKGKIKPKLQNHKKATYTKLLKKSDGEINWSEHIEIIERKIRAYCPWPGTYTFINGKRLKIHKAHLKDGKLFLDLVQLEGKKKISWQEFCRGYNQSLDKLAKIVYNNPCK